MLVLKGLPAMEAGCVIERLATWARLELQDKELVSEEVGAGFVRMVARL